jgi:hypothetical protein
VADPPRTIVLPAPVLPDPDPIEIGVYRYYILAAAPVPTPDTPSEPWWEPVYSAVGTAFASSSAPVRAPEIDSTGAASGLTLLAGCLAVGMGRRK